jgi:hypothetical protein
VSVLVFYDVSLTAGALQHHIQTLILDICKHWYNALLQGLREFFAKDKGNGGVPDQRGGSG